MELLPHTHRALSHAAGALLLHVFICMMKASASPELFLLNKPPRSTAAFPSVSGLHGRCRDHEVSPNCTVFSSYLVSIPLSMDFSRELTHEAGTFFSDILMPVTQMPGICHANNTTHILNKCQFA